MPHLFYIPGEKLTYVASSIATALSEQFVLEDLFVLSALLASVSTELDLIATQRDSLNNYTERVSSTNKSAKTETPQPEAPDIEEPEPPAL
jgi:hypothetical protein